MAIGLVSWNTSEVGADTVTATWDRNSESNIAGYRLSYGTQSGTYTTTIDVGNVTTTQVNNLNSGQRYYFVVQAINTSKQISPRSAEVFADIGVATSAPTITSLSPTSGAVGTSVTIAGTNFGATKGTSTVTFNGITATTTSWSATSLIVQVPTGASTGNVVVTVGGRASNLKVFTVNTTLPAPWTARDIGTPALAGSASWASGIFSLKGAGLNIGDLSDQFRFVYQTLDGDAEIIARVASLQNTHALAKAGLMIRQDLTGGARNAFALVSAGNGLTFQRRVTPNGQTTSGAVFPGAAPYWVRLVRSGNTFRAYYKSTTGVPWISMGSAVVSMSSRIYIGLAVSSHVSSIAATATFSNVTVRSLSGTTSLSLAATAASASSLSIDSSTQAGTTTLSGPHEARSDYDGDGKADVAVYAPSTGKWSILKSSNDMALTVSLGAPGDLPVPGDYDGDRKTDIAAYRPATGEWSILLSSTNYVTRLTASLGSDADIPVPGDYDGDRLTDIAVYQPVTGQWQILKSTTRYATSFVTLLGTSGDIPVPGDYDGDGKIDLAVYRPGTGSWRILQSTTDYTVSLTVLLGSSGDIPVPADYDGDGRTDVATQRPSNGVWRVLRSSTDYSTSFAISWGSASDVAIPGDFDGDGKADLGLFRSGGWQILLSSTNYNASLSVSWGKVGEVALPRRP